MRLNKNLVFLGFVFECRYVDTQGKETMLSFLLKENLDHNPGAKKQPYALCASENGKRIFILPWRYVSIRDAPKTKRKARALFKRWSAFHADLAFVFNVPDSARQLPYAGRLKAIEYTSDKVMNNSDRQGDFHLYHHKYITALNFYRFTRGKVKIWGAKKARGNSVIVTSRGLVG